MRLGGFVPVCWMIPNPFHERRVLDAGADLDGAAAVVARFDIDCEHPFEALGLRLMAT